MKSVRSTEYVSFGSVKAVSKEKGRNESGREREKKKKLTKALAFVRRTATTTTTMIGKKLNEEVVEKE